MCDYNEVYEVFWKDIVEDSDGNIDVEQVKKELADYKMILDEVPKVYDQLVGLSKPHTRASIITDRVEERFIRRQDAFDDLLTYAEDGEVTISVEDLQEYLLK